jgi:hypothetical protein
VVCNLVVNERTRPRVTEHASLFSTVLARTFNDANTVNQVCYLDTCRYILSDPRQTAAHTQLLNLMGPLVHHLLKNLSVERETREEAGGQHAAAVRKTNQPSHTELDSTV